MSWGETEKEGKSREGGEGLQAGRTEVGCEVRSQQLYGEEVKEGGKGKQKEAAAKGGKGKRKREKGGWSDWLAGGRRGRKRPQAAQGEKKEKGSGKGGDNEYEDKEMGLWRLFGDQQ